MVFSYMGICTTLFQQLPVAGFGRTNMLYNMFQFFDVAMNGTRIDT